MKKIYLLIVCFLTINNIVAQQEQIKPCGTVSPDDYNTYENSNIYRSANSTFAVPPNYCMNVFFRIVANDDGTLQAFNPNNLTQLLTELNNSFSPHQINFVMSGAGYEVIKNTALNNGTTSIANIPNAINVFIQKRIPFGDTSVAGIAYAGSQLIKISTNGNFNSIPKGAFIHEMGHMINLLHTHRCYCDGYGEFFIPSCAERLDGLECETRGDMICDTPADPLHCTSSGVNISDFNPDKTNYMSYYGGFENIAPTHFTPGQGLRMRNAILNKPSLQSARSNQCTVIEGPTNLCNNLQFTFSIMGYGNPIFYNWSVGTNLQIVGSTTNANVIIKVTNPNINVSTTLTVTVNGIVKTINFNTASLSNYNSGAYITTTSGGICVVGDSKTFTINNLQTTETLNWIISDSYIADIFPDGNQATVTATGNGSGPQTVTAKITNTCGQISTKIKTLYIGTPTFNKFTFGCANRSLCIASDGNYSFTSPTALNTKNRVIANFFGLTATEAVNSANWQWQEAPGNHLLYINTTSPKNYLDLCPIAAGTTILQVRAKNSSCNDFSEWVDLEITIVQLPSSMSFRQTQSPGVVSLRDNDSNTLGNIENTQYLWANNNIWVRNNQDGIIEHQNPVFNESSPNYMYVRIANTGCTGLPGGIRLKTYWAKAATSLNWPQSWNDSKYNNTETSLGGQIGEVALPELGPEQETIISMPFMVPNPDKYNNIVNQPWRFGLLARAVSESDEATGTETDDLVQNLINNENIALKNVTVVDLANDNPEEQTIGGVIAVGNTFDTPKSFYLELVKEDLETGKPIYDEAEVSLKLDETLYQAWVRGGKTAERLDNTLDDKMKLVKDNNVFLKDLELSPNETGTLYVKFNFLTKEITDKSKYMYHVIQRETGTNKIIGGQTYVIKKQQRPLFTADAGGTKYVDKNEPITISAAQISESAVYNWYDADGNFITSGKDLNIATEIAQKYKLEVIAADGFKDYTEVEVKLNPNTLGTISPNPVVNSANITYKINEASSAYLMILGGYGTTGDSNNYILDIDSSGINIDLSYYSSGFYTVALVCDGQIVDAKTLVKE
jgi:hypothetical protein